MQYKQSAQSRAIERSTSMLFMRKLKKGENVKYAKKINMRLRKKLEFKTPHECFYEQIK